MKIYHQRFSYISFLFAIILTASNAIAQDAMFSQFYAAPLYLNPSLAGAETNVIVGMNYRTQWNSLQSPYQTNQFSFIFPLITNGYRRKHLGGIGATVYNEQLGENHNFKTNGFVGSATYNLTLDKYRNNFISFGLQGGIIQKRIGNNLNWGSQYDPFFGFNNAITPSVNGLSQVTSFPVVNSGFTFFYNSQKILHKTSALLGFAASNMNRPDESLIQSSHSRLPMLLKAHASIDNSLTRYLSVSYNVLWMSQNGLNQINTGAYISHKAHAKKDPFITTLGVWYRLKDSFIVMTGFSKSQFSIGLSYDLNSSSLRYTTRGGGAYEVSLTYRIPKVKNLRRFSTPLM
jgi:type IX secretion system PorP/SprF family membrane protein